MALFIIFAMRFAGQYIKMSKLEKFNDRKGGIYIHIPFCRRKCLYCDFYSGSPKTIDMDFYIDSLVNELKGRVNEMSGFRLPTVYIGGGTPSLIPPEKFKRLAGEIICLADARKESSYPSEFTIEVNPDDVTDFMAQCWKEAGVNRISMGVQSLDDSELKTIGRRHDAARAIEAFHILRKYFDNISLDLMFGLPGQTRESLCKTLKQFISLQPDHISAYSLMFEERTAITRMRDMGKIAEQDDEDCVEMFRLVSRMLANAGYERYEISNYALPGRRSVHNSSYWTGEPYIGIGPSAHSYDGKRLRRANPADIRRYLEVWGKASAAEGFIIDEILDDEELREEMLLTRLRTSEGLDIEQYAARFGGAASFRLGCDSAPFIERNELCLERGMLRLTEEGVMISDEIISSLM